eukprot:4727884-Lingulodinium_polyedra.AAC.1
MQENADGRHSAATEAHLVHHCLCVHQLLLLMLQGLGALAKATLRDAMLRRPRFPCRHVNSKPLGVVPARDAETHQVLS